MRFLHRYSIRHPLIVLVLAGLVVAAIAPGLLRLELRTDGHALVPPDSPEIHFDELVRSEFDAQDLFVIVIRPEHPSGVYNPDTLGLIHALTLAIQALPEVEPENVASLDTEYNHRVRTGTLKFRRLLEPLPKDSKDCELLRADVAKIALYVGTIVTQDGSAASILVGVPRGVARPALYARLRALVREHAPAGEQINVIGAPVAESLLGTHILEDLGVPRRLLGQWANPEPPAAGHGPLSVYRLRRLVARHVGLMPIAVLMMAVVFVVSFRSLTAALLPLIEIGAALVFVFGLMGWLGVPIYLTIAVMPVILTAIGVADEIHVFARYVQELRTRAGGHHDALRAALDEMWLPVVKTSVTTTVGFLSFALSPIPPVQAFGIFTAVGILFCMLWSLTVIPASLALAPPAWFVRSRGSSPTGTRSPGERLCAWIARCAVRRRRIVLPLAALVACAAPLGLRRVVVQDSWIDGFAPDSVFYQATQAFNKQFLGMHVLLVRVATPHDTFTGSVPLGQVEHHSILLPATVAEDPERLVGQRIVLRRVMGTDGQNSAANPPPLRRADSWRARIGEVRRTDDHLTLVTDRRSGSPLISLKPQPGDRLEYEIRIQPLTDPAVIRRIGDLETFIAGQTQHTVGGVIGTASYIRTTNFMARGVREEMRRIPDTADDVEWLWEQYANIRGAERLHQVVDENYADALVTVFLKNANYVDVQALMDAISDYEAAHLAPHAITLGFAGDVAVSQSVIRGIVRTQVRSLAVSLVGVWLVTSLMARSLRWGLYCVLPCAAAVLLNFAIMGWVGIPLGVATSMFAGMTLGIGVDFAIHLLERYRLARSRGATGEAALADAATFAGPAIAIDALGIAVGFAVLLLSQVPANARLGALVMLSIVNCLAGTLLVLPALLRIWPPPPRARASD